MHGQIRFTEQGEVISFRYALPQIAHRHLEQIVSASILASDDGHENNHDLDPSILRELAEVSMRHYRGLIEDDDFWPWFSASLRSKRLRDSLSHPDRYHVLPGAGFNSKIFAHPMGLLLDSNARPGAWLVWIGDGSGATGRQQTQAVQGPCQDRSLHQHGAAKCSTRNGQVRLPIARLYAEVVLMGLSSPNESRKSSRVHPRPCSISWTSQRYCHTRLSMPSSSGTMDRHFEFDPNRVPAATKQR